MAWSVSSDPVAFAEAIAWFRKRVPMTRAERDRLTDEARLRAFWVSHVAKADLVHQAWTAIDKALSKGTSLEDFKKEVGESLRAAWAGSVKDPAWRLETIFRTNIQHAYAAGRHHQATAPEVLADRPVWMFDAILDGRETPICEACDGTKLPADHSWWRTHTPPLHHNCRSSVITLTEEQAGELSKAPKAQAQDGFGNAPRDDDAWRPGHDRYPEQLAFAFVKQTENPPIARSTLSFVDFVEPEDLRKAHGVAVSGDVKELTKRLFDGKCPDAESWGRIWQLPEGYSVRLERFSASGKQLNVAARMLDATGRDLGGLHRYFERDSEGRLIVHHGLFKIQDPRDQGKGLGEALTRSAIRAYLDMGVHRIDTSPHWVGRYTWARFGFSWSDDDAKHWQGKLRDFLMNEHGFAQQRAERFSNAALLGAPHVADLVIDGEQVGKKFLLNDRYVPSWEGSLHLDKNDVGFKWARKRLKL